MQQCELNEFITGSYCSRFGASRKGVINSESLSFRPISSVTVSCIIFSCEQCIFNSVQDRGPVIEQVIQSLSVDNSKESPGISGGKGVGKKKREAVKCKAACLCGRAPGQTKRLKVIVSSTGSEIQESRMEGT